MIMDQWDRWLTGLTVEPSIKCRPLHSMGFFPAFFTETESSDSSSYGEYVSPAQQATHSLPSLPLSLPYLFTVLPLASNNIYFQRTGCPPSIMHPIFSVFTVSPSPLPSNAAAYFSTCQGNMRESPCFCCLQDFHQRDKRSLTFKSHFFDGILP